MTPLCLPLRQNNLENEMDTAGIDRGFAFAEELDALVRRLGPADLTTAEQSAFVSYMNASAVGWVQARNRARAVPQPHKEPR